MMCRTTRRSAPAQWWSVILANLHGADIFLYAVTPDFYPDGIDSLFDPNARTRNAASPPEPDATPQSPAAAKVATEARPDHMAQYRAAHMLYADEHFAEALEQFRAPHDRLVFKVSALWSFAMRSDFQDQWSVKEDPRAWY